MPRAGTVLLLVLNVVQHNSDDRRQLVTTALLMGDVWRLTQRCGDGASSGSNLLRQVRRSTTPQLAAAVTARGGPRHTATRRDATRRSGIRAVARSRRARKQLPTDAGRPGTGGPAPPPPPPPPPPPSEAAGSVIGRRQARNFTGSWTGAGPPGTTATRGRHYQHRPGACRLAQLFVAGRRSPVAVRRRRLEDARPIGAAGRARASDNKRAER